MLYLGPIIVFVIRVLLLASLSHMSTLAEGSGPVIELCVLDDEGQFIRVKGGYCHGEKGF